MFSKFNEEAQKVLINAQKEMKSLKHSYIGSEHLLLSLLKNSNSVKEKLEENNLNYKLFKNKLIEIVGMGDDNNNWFIYTPLLKKILETAMYISKESNNNEVTAEILIFSLLEEDEGIAIKILNSLDIDISSIQEYFSSLILNKKNYNKKRLLIEEFGINLCDKAKLNCIDPVIGREEEIQRTIEILCRRCKNNPLLIGDAGVGKTAIVEELARLIVLGKVPPLLRNKRIYSVSIASLVAGTKYRGEFEERITTLLNELEEDDSIILFIDEIHTLMGAGGAEGAIDAANIFKPALARGKLKLIGATTTLEYKQTILKDKAIERRFQTVFVEEPSSEKTFEILKKLKSIYEDFHNVKVDDICLKSIIDLTNKYVYDRKQPDKAIDILDEVCSKVALSNCKTLNKLDEYNFELANIVDKKNKCIIDHNFDEASKLRIKEKEIYSYINKYKIKNINRMEKKEVNLNDIADVIYSKTKIPIYEINSNNNLYVNKIKRILKNKIKGQDEAIDKLIKFTKRKMLGFKNNNKPYSLLFVGPTGVGKTLLAEEYSNCLFGKDNIIRLDMSEYKDPSSVSKLIGSNPGYVGYDDFSNKLEEIKNKPNSVILLDEIEKADISVINLFLQILDNGKISDSKGNIIRFDNNIIIMTSNIGYNSIEIGFNPDNNIKSKLMDFLSMEFINRIDTIIEFNSFDKNSIKQIIDSKIDSIIKMFSSKNIDLNISKNVISDIVDLVEFNIFGARKIDKVIEDKINNYVIEELLLGKNIIKIDTI